MKKVSGIVALDLDIQVAGKFYPGCKARGPSYYDGGTPAEPPEFETHEAVVILPDGSEMALPLDGVSDDAVVEMDKQALAGMDEYGYPGAVTLSFDAVVEIAADDKAHFTLWGVKFPVELLGISEDPAKVWAEFAE